VAGLDEKQFLEAAERANEGCPVTRALAGVGEITLEATLEN
jgi:osmotically inducible protein OsmC